MPTPLDNFIKLIRSGAFETKGLKNTVKEDFPIFIESMKKSRHPNSLTFYDAPGYMARETRLFKVPGIDAGFAVAGDGDIISVHNNSNIRGIGPFLIEAAKARGGSHLDHFDFPRLNEVYGSQGLQRFGHWPWNDEYAPEHWNYEIDGRPDVILRGTPGYVEEYCSNPENVDNCLDLEFIDPEMHERVSRNRKARGGSR